MRSLTKLLATVSKTLSTPPTKLSVVRKSGHFAMRWKPPSRSAFLMYPSLKSSSVSNTSRRKHSVLRSWKKAFALTAVTSTPYAISMLRREHFLVCMVRPSSHVVRPKHSQQRPSHQLTSVNTLTTTPVVRTANALSFTTASLHSLWVKRAASVA